VYSYSKDLSGKKIRESKLKYENYRQSLQCEAKQGRNMNKESQLDFLRKEWLSFLKWTAGISSFLIIALLTILTLSENLQDLSSIDLCILLWMAIIIPSHIAMTWGIQAYSIYIYYPRYFDKKQKYPVFSKWLVISLEILNTLLFGLGFYLFIRFVLNCIS